MKDYTKYDFAAIVGAEVEIRYRLGEEPLIAKLIHFDSETKILTLLAEKKNDVPVGFIYVSEILSLTARIKVEDMSLKQMMEFCFHEGNCNYVVLYNDKTCVSTCGKHAKNIELTDYIDCTDWGWEHE